MKDDELKIFVDPKVYNDFIKRNRKKKLLHSFAENNLKIILKEINPESYPVDESNINGGRVDLVYYFDSIGHTIHFEIFASYSTVIKDLRLLEQSEFDIKVAILIDDEIDPSVPKKFFKEKPTNPFPFFNLSQIFMNTKIEDFKREIGNLIKTFKLGQRAEETRSDLIKTESIKRFRGFSPSKKDLLDLEDIKYCQSKLRKGNLNPKTEERILSDISNNLSIISHIETLREESKNILQNLLKFLFNYLKGKGESTLIGILKILIWICRSEMLSSAKSIFYEYFKLLLDKKNRYNELLEVLFWFGHFEDRVFWISIAIDEKNLEFINILTRDLRTPKLLEQKFEIRDMLYKKLDVYEQDSEYVEIVQKIHFLLEKLKNVKKK